MQAATVEIGSTLVQTVSSAAGKKEGDGSNSSKVPQPLAAVGGIGMELLRVSGGSAAAATSAAYPGGSAAAAAD
jgi:hypothetical protein